MTTNTTNVSMTRAAALIGTTAEALETSSGTPADRHDAFAALARARRLYSLAKADATLAGDAYRAARKAHNRAVLLGA